MEIENELWKEPEDGILTILNDFLEKQNGSWDGSASELLDEIFGELEEIYEEYKPNTLVRKLNVSASKLKIEYGIFYQNKRTNKGSKIRLIKRQEQGRD